METELKFSDRFSDIHEGAELDLTTVPADTKVLQISRIRKADLPRLLGLERLPIEALELRWLSAPDLTAVPLPPTLRKLAVGQSRLKSMAGLEAAQQLEVLIWEQNGVLEDGAALRKLPKLKQLHLEGGLDGRQRLTSLDFLEGLKLERLQLDAIRAEGLDLGPVARLGADCEVLLNPRNFPQDELAKVAATHSEVYREAMTLVPAPAGTDNICKTCGATKGMLYLKGAKFLWCEACERAALKRHLDTFDALVKKARRALDT